MLRLGVNIDHVATVRQARMTFEPDPVWAAVEADLGGADGITFHLREDRRHIQDRDAVLLGETVNAKLNMEMAMAAPIVRVAIQLKPDQVCLVPEKRQEVTTEGGLDVVKGKRKAREIVKKMHTAGVEVSMFIDPVVDQIKASADIGADSIELHTGTYANARTKRQSAKSLRALEKGLIAGLELDLDVHAGHGLTYHNVEPLAAMVGFSEFNIGHSIIARAMFVGLRQAVREMKDLLIGSMPKD
jgi:pyridoxine 5-phosphate synthase